MEKRVAVIGANGQLGTDLCRVFHANGATVLPLLRKDVDVRDETRVRQVFSELKPEVVINTSAFHNVEVCEQNPQESFAVNAIAPRTLALASRDLDAVLVHFSTDYVFGSTNRAPHKEIDLPHPLNVYGASKLAGETMIALTWPKHFVVRTCGLYGLAGSSGKGGNFVETMLRKAGERNPIRVVDDQVLSPTLTLDVAEAVYKLVGTNAYGLFHVSAEGQCSWYEFASQIFELQGVDPELSAVSSKDFASPVMRPAYSVLSKEKLRQLGIEMARWQDGLRRYLKARGSASRAAQA
jgi:dTDP-4-dehydrorhamnose reductase